MSAICPNLPSYLIKILPKQIQSVKRSLQEKCTPSQQKCQKTNSAIKVTAPQSCDDEVLQIIPTVIEHVNDSVEEWEDVSEPSSTKPSELCRTRCVENSPRYPMPREGSTPGLTLSKLIIRARIALEYCGAQDYATV
ncbi:hypothetical protein CHUAL_009525 [Chamberlinius hualienensis]